jgi:hypothetical protein
LTRHGSSKNPARADRGRAFEIVVSRRQFKA